MSLSSICFAFPFPRCNFTVAFQFLIADRTLLGLIVNARQNVPKSILSLIVVEFCWKEIALPSMRCLQWVSFRCVFFLCKLISWCRYYKHTSQLDCNDFRSNYARSLVATKTNRLHLAFKRLVPNRTNVSRCAREILLRHVIFDSR